MASVERRGTSDYWLDENKTPVNCREEESGIAIRNSLPVLRIMKHGH